MTAVDELIEEFADLDEHEACQVLDELGRDLPKIPDSVYVDANLISGCQSRVWMVCSLSQQSPARLEILADSDAIIVKGLVSVLLQMYVGRTPAEAVEVDHVRIFDSLGLGRMITPQRKNGLHSMVRAIRSFASQQAGVDGVETLANPHPREPNRVIPDVSRSIANVAADFPILQRTLPNGNLPVFLDSGASSQKPKRVIEKEREVEEQYYANAFRGRYYFGQRIDDEIEAARAIVAGFVGAASSDEIVFTSGTTMSLNMVAQGWGRKFLKPGDEVVITEMEHHANFVPWQEITRETGAKLRIIPVTTDGQLDTEAADSMIHEATALIAVCSMSNVLGTVNPIAEICQAAHRVGAVVVVDAAQSVAHGVTDVVLDDVDFLVFSAHKMYGPSGVGVLYGRGELLAKMDPCFFGGHMIERVGRDRSSWAMPPAKFEAGTMPIVQIIGLGEAVDFVHSVGFAAIEERDRELVAAAHRDLSAIPGLRIHGPALDHKGAIVSFSIDGVATEDLAIRLDQRGVFTRHGHHCAMVLHERLGVAATTRASFGIYNTLEDVAALVDAVKFGVNDIRR